MSFLADLARLNLITNQNMESVMADGFGARQVAMVRALTTRDQNFLLAGSTSMDRINAARAQQALIKFDSDLQVVRGDVAGLKTDVRETGRKAAQALTLARAASASGGASGFRVGPTGVRAGVFQVGKGGLRVGMGGLRSALGPAFYAVLGAHLLGAGAEGLADIVQDIRERRDQGQTSGEIGRAGGLTVAQRAFQLFGGEAAARGIGALNEIGGRGPSRKDIEKQIQRFFQTSEQNARDDQKMLAAEAAVDEGIRKKLAEATATLSQMSPRGFRFLGPGSEAAYRREMLAINQPALKRLGHELRLLENARKNGVD